MTRRRPDERDWRDVRPVALGVPWRSTDGSPVGDPPPEDPAGAELLVEEYDLDERFFRPLGGGVRFGESSAAAVRREFREETGYDVCVDGRLGVVENVFELDGDRHHELAVVYAVSFLDRTAYRSDSLDITESDGERRTATWQDLSTLRARPEPLYPTEVDAVLVGETDHVLPE